MEKLNELLFVVIVLVNSHVKHCKSSRKLSKGKRKLLREESGRSKKKKKENQLVGESARWKAHLPFELRCRVACVGLEGKFTVKKK